MKFSTLQVDELLSRGIFEVIDRGHLRKRLLAGGRLRLKLGIDPTGTKLHLGHAVPLRIMRRLQDAGHVVILVIGDTTAGIGDPSGKNETRPPLTVAQIKKNYASYERQVFLILDKSKTEVRWQSEWYGKFTLADVVAQASRLSAGWILSHETFRERVRSGQPLALHELLYPLLQAYDSVAIKADVEFGGLDQKFNLLTGRELMRAHGMEPQDVVLAKYLIGTDGQKMGKTLGNYIALEEEPFEMFGKVMSMPDSVLKDYFELATDLPMDEVQKMGFEGSQAKNTKQLLAQMIVRSYHGKPESEKAMRMWLDKFVSKTVKLAADGIAAKQIAGKMSLRDLVAQQLEISKSEAQRRIEQGGVLVDGATEKDWKKTVQAYADGKAHELIIGKKKVRIPFSVRSA